MQMTVFCIELVLELISAVALWNLYRYLPASCGLLNGFVNMLLEWCLINIWLIR